MHILILSYLLFNVPSIVCVVFAGACEGIQDNLSFHNYSNNSFWGQNSWVNKYKNKQPLLGQTFRGKYFTFTTDGFHLIKFLKDLFLMATIALKIGESKEWYYILMEGIIYWIIYRVGFVITYNNIKIK